MQNEAGGKLDTSLLLGYGALLIAQSFLDLDLALGMSGYRMVSEVPFGLYQLVRSSQALNHC